MGGRSAPDPVRFPWPPWPVRPGWSLVTRAGVGLLLSGGLSLLGVAVVLLARAPDRGLVWQLWRAPVVEPVLGFQVAAGAALLAWAVHPVRERAVAAWLAGRGLAPVLGPDAAAELRRVRTWRVVPAFAGFCLGFGTLAAANLALAVTGSMPEPLLAAAAGDWPPPLGLALGGYLAGTVAAELFRKRPAAAPRQGGARLVPRRPGGYLTRPARRLPDLVAGGILVLLGVHAARALPDSPAVLPAALAAVVGLTLGVRAVQWWVVRRPQRLGDPDALALDDTLRSSAAHAVVGAACAAGLALTGSLLSDLDLWNGIVAGRVSGWVALPLVLATVALSLATLVVWLQYGSTHRGVRPGGGARP